MEKFDVYVLGCGSALPTLRHFPASQVLNVHEKLFMIDCGEGTQQQMRKMRLSFSRLNRIFISHLHGDHCFGLIGLISTFSLLGRTATLHIHAPAELETLLTPLLAYHCHGAAFAVEFHPFNGKQPQLIYDDRSVSVTAIPLRHRLTCCGFLFKEKPPLPHIRRDMIDYLGIPYFEINRIKQGGSWTRDDGSIVPHKRLVTPAAPPRSYAYFSDTAPCPNAAKYIEDVTLLYHEATFAEADAPRAVETRHSTAKQAAQIATLARAHRLLIGHYSSRYDDEALLLQESQSVFPDTILAREGLHLAL